MKRLEKKQMKRAQRKRRIRAKVAGSSDRPRLTVFRSNKNVSAQIINDVTGETLASSSTLSLSNAKGTLKERAAEVGADLATKAVKKDISNVAFDRSGYRYVGVVKALADGARENGLTF